MPGYGRYRNNRRKRFTASRNTARSVAVKAKRVKNKAVARTQRKTWLSKPARNTDSIISLAKQVRTLQRTQMGAFQKEYHYYSPLVDVSSGRVFERRQPILFAANNFLSDASIYLGRNLTTGVPAANTPGHVIAGSWSKNTFSESVSEEYNYWHNETNNNASIQGYKPISTRVSIHINSTSMPARSTRWVRIDQIRVKKMMKDTDSHHLTLPSNVQALSNLAVDNGPMRNRINREYFTIKKTKWVKLFNAGDTVRDVEKTVTLNYRFGDKRTPCEQLKSGVLIQDANNHPHVTSFETQMPQRAIDWVLINTDYETDLTGASTHNNMHIKMNRYISYRDRDDGLAVPLVVLPS